MVRPRKVETVYMDKKPLADSAVESVSGYLVIYLIVFFASALLISIYNPNMTEMSLQTSFSASLTCINNVGPGLTKVIGPSGNFSQFSNFSKFILTIEMIAGRLELFPIILLFSPSTWRKRI